MSIYGVVYKFNFIVEIRSFYCESMKQGCPRETTLFELLSVDWTFRIEKIYSGIVRAKKIADFGLRSMRMKKIKIDFNWNDWIVSTLTFCFFKQLFN